MQDLTFFKGREAWVGEFLKMLPEDRSILRNYVWNAAQATDANAGHHVAMGLILLSQIGPQYGIRLGAGDVTSNLYALVLGSSGSRKTACLKVGRRVGVAAGMDTLITTHPGSREGFIDSLDVEIGGHPHQALVYNEFADFLGITASAAKGRGGGHAATLRGEIMNAYDCEPIERKLSSSRNADTGQMQANVRGTKNPVVSLIGAANYFVLSKNTTTDDWMDGFMGRFFMLDGEMERFYPRQRAWPAEMQQVIDVLRWRLEQERNRAVMQSPIFPLPDATCDMTPEAYDLFVAWSHSMFAKQQTEDNGLVASAMMRLDSLCQRLATLISLDCGEVGGQGMPQPGWRIDVDSMRAAIFLAERHLVAYQYAASNVVLNEEERPIREVEHVLRKADCENRMLTEGEIGRAISRNVRSVGDALMALQVRQVVRKVGGTDGTTVMRYQVIGGLTERILYLPGVEQPAGTAVTRLAFFPS